VNVAARAILAVVGGCLCAFAGYDYGHQEGMQDADTYAMGQFFNKCLVSPTPPACQAMLDFVMDQGRGEAVGNATAVPE